MDCPDLLARPRYTSAKERCSAMAKRTSTRIARKPRGEVLDREAKLTGDAGPLLLFADFSAGLDGIELRLTPGTGGVPPPGCCRRI
jgi:hypothetical protein